jgi:pyruvate kinase
VEVISLENIKYTNSADMLEKSNQYLVDKGLLQKGDKFINTMSFPLTENNRTNTVRLSIV